MSNIQKRNLLALSVAALVASSVAALAGVTTFKSDLTGEAVYLATEMQCGSGCWYDEGIHGCKCPESGNAYPPSGESGYPNVGTTVPVLAPTKSVSKYTQCWEVCPMIGGKDCAKECNSLPGAPSAAESAKATAATVDRCAMPNNITDYCDQICGCAAQLYGSANSVEKTKDWYITYWPGKDEIGNTKTKGSCMEVCKADRAKVQAPVVPAVEPPPVAPVSTPSLDDGQHTAAPAFDESFEDQPSPRLRPASFGGDYDDFGGDVDGGFREGFHGGPGDDFGFPMEDFSHFGDVYGREFDPSMMQEGFDEYFGGFGPGMGGEFGGDYGGGFGGDFGGESGEMPPWMREEFRNTKDIVLDAAGGFCPDFDVSLIEGAETPDDLWEAGMAMEDECGGPGMGGEGGPPDPEMMANAAEMLQIFADQDGPVYHALDVAQRHNVFTAGEVREINDILAQLGEKANEAEAVCMDLPELPDMDMMGGEEEDFLGFKGLLAQLFDDEEEGDDEEFEDDDEEGGTFDGEMPEEFRAYEECGEVLDAALGAGPDQDEEEMGSGLMGALEGLMREPMEAAVEDGTIPQEEWDEVESRFEEVMADLGFEEEFDKSFQEEEGFREVDEGEREVEEGGTDEEEGDFEDVDF